MRRRTDLTLRHMSQRLYVFKPGAGVKAGAHLSIYLSATNGNQPEASAVVVLKSGSVRYHRFKLDRTNDGVATVKFARGVVRRVVLVIGNAGVRFNCWVDPNSYFSCYGSSRDNKRRMSFSARQA